MTRWRRINQVWCNWPSRPRGLIEMIGGTYLAINPQISYRRLLEAFVDQNFAVSAWGYIPGFDHQAQANEAWKSMRYCRKNLESRIGRSLLPIRLGHSLGCKLHLLAPDGGRNSKSLISLSFNNYAANQSIPMIEKIAPKLGFRTEFSPSPLETMRLISESYLQERNLIIQFFDDRLDQSEILLDCLQRRGEDSSKIFILDGDHLTPASAGVRKRLPVEWAKSPSRETNLKRLLEKISQYIQDIS